MPGCRRPCACVAASTTSARNPTSSTVAGRIECRGTATPSFITAACRPPPPTNGLHADKRHHGLVAFLERHLNAPLRRSLGKEVRPVDGIEHPRARRRARRTELLPKNRIVGTQLGQQLAQQQLDS